MGGRCSQNIELSEPSEEAVSAADTLLVFQALAEGLQMALAEITTEEDR